jgi:hypothetical protein
VLLLVNALPVALCHHRACRRSCTWTSSCIYAIVDNSDAPGVAHLCGGNPARGGDAAGLWKVRHWSGGGGGFTRASLAQMRSTGGFCVFNFRGLGSALSTLRMRAGGAGCSRQLRASTVQGVQRMFCYSLILAAMLTGAAVHLFSAPAPLGPRTRGSLAR